MSKFLTGNLALRLVAVLGATAALMAGCGGTVDETVGADTETAQASSPTTAPTTTVDEPASALDAGDEEPDEAESVDELLARGAPALPILSEIYVSADGIVGPHSFDGRLYLLDGPRVQILDPDTGDIESALLPRDDEDWSVGFMIEDAADRLLVVGYGRDRAGTATLVVEPDTLDQIGVGQYLFPFSSFAGPGREVAVQDIAGKQLHARPRHHGRG